MTAPRTFLDAATRPGVLALAVVVVLAALVAPAGVAGDTADGAAGDATAAVQPISSCTTISSSGTYELSSNVTATNDSSCIKVTADNVTIDGNGYTIHGYQNYTYDSNGNPEHFNGSTGINVTGSLDDRVENVTIRNVTVEGGNVGIVGENGHDLTLEGVTVRQTTFEAIVTAGTNGTVALRDVTVTGSTTWFTNETGEYVPASSDPAIEIGVTGPAPEDEEYVEEVIISNLTATDNGHMSGTTDEGTLKVYAMGPVTVTDSVIERSAGGGMQLQTRPLDWDSMDVTVTNVTVRNFNQRADANGGSSGADPGIYVDAGDEATVRNSTVTDADDGGGGFYVSSDWDAVFTNNTVRNVEVDQGADLTEAGVHVTSSEDTILRDVRVADTGNGSGITASGVAITVRNVTVNGTADTFGWGAEFDGSRSTTVRNVTVRDSGDGGLHLDAHENLDARNLSVENVRFQEDGGSDDPFDHGEGLVVRGSGGSVRDVDVVDTAGGVRVVEDNSDSPAFYPGLTFENLTVTNTSHHGIDVRGDDLEFDDVTVRNTSKAGVVKRPETFGSTVDLTGVFSVENLTVEGAGTDGVAARLTDEGLDNGPNDNVTMTNVDIVDSGDAGVEFHHVTASTLENVTVTNAAGTDLNATNASATLANATLSGTRFDGVADNVTVEPVDAGAVRPLPDGTDSVGASFEANPTAEHGYLDATVHYGDSVPAGLDESTLQVWRDDGSRWSAVGGTTDAGANTVSKNVTYFSTFALLGTDGTPDPAANFTVEVTGTDDPVWEHVPLTVTAAVTNERGSQETQTVELLDFDGNVVDSQQVTVDAGSTESVALEWTMENATADTREVAVRSEHGWDTADVEMSPIAGESILGCAVVTEPGSYELARNLSTGGDQPCIVVQSSDVTIDGQGLRITGPSGAASDKRGTAVVVDVQDDPAANVTVRNLTVENVTSVAELSAGDDTLSNVAFRNVSAPSVASGIDATGSFDGLTVRDSNITVSGDERGDAVTLDPDGSNAEIRDVTVSNVTIRNEAGATTRGVNVQLGDERVTLDGLEVSNSTIHTQDEPVAVAGFLGDPVGSDSAIRNVTVADSDLQSATDPVVFVDYANTDTLVDGVRIEDNHVRGDENAHGIVLSALDARGTKTRDVVVTGNDVASVDHGVHVPLENGYAEVNGLEISDNTISADGHAVYVDATTGGEDSSVRDVSVRNNSLSGSETGIRVWVTGDGITTGDVGVTDNDVSATDTGLELQFGSTGSARYDATVSGNDVSGYATTGVALDAQADPGAVLELSENNVTSDAAATGIAVQTSSNNATGNGTLAITRNTVRTGGDAVVVNADTPGGGPVDSLDIRYNVLDAPGFGVQNHNTASHDQGRAWVNATNNYWNASDGPGSAGGLTDPVTGATADGSGSNVSAGGSSGVANVHFDPHASSANPTALFATVEGTNSPVTAGGTVSVTATVENIGDETASQTVALSVGGTERDTAPVTLDGGESTTVTLDWATSAGDAGNYTATVATANHTDSTEVAVDPLTPGNLSVTVDSTDAPATAGEPLNVTATVENVGDETASQTVNLSTGGTERDTAPVTLDGGESTTVTLTWNTQPGADGSYTAVVASENDTDSTPVTVDPAPTPATFAVTVDATNAPVTEGETLTVDATVENTGDSDGSTAVTLSTDGTERDTATVELDAGNTTTVTLEWTTERGDLGDYTATVATGDDSASSQVTVDADGVPVSSCTVIDTPGRYVLTGSVSDGAAGTCIEITSSDVVLDGYGHTLNGVDSSGTGIRVAGSTTLENVTVRNVVLVEWQTAVVLGDQFGTGVENATIESVTADQNDAAVVLANASNASVRDNVVRFNHVGVEVSDSSADSVVRNNTVRESGDAGIDVSGTNNTVRNNTLAENAVGVYVPRFGTEDLAVVGNEVRNSSGAGVEVRASGARFENNTVRGNDVGVSLLGASDNAFRNTTLVGNANGSVVAIPTTGETASSAANNTFTDADLGYSSATLSFTLRDAALAPEPAASTPALPDNTSDVGVYLNATNTTAAGYVDLTVAYDDAAVATVDESTLSVWRHDGNWSDVGGVVDASANTVSKNLTTRGVFAPLGGPASGLGSPPTAKFTQSPSTVYVGEEVTFDASTTTDPDGDAATYEWDLDGDSTYEESTSSPTLAHTYGSAGERTVRLRVTDSEGNTDTVEATTTVLEGGPTAEFARSPATVYVGEDVTFDAAGSLDPTGDVATYEWDLDGDDTYEETGSTVSTTYGSTGNRTVALRVTDEHGYADTVNRTVTVLAGGPTADLAYSPTEPEVGDVVTLDASNATDPTGDVVSYGWDLDGDGAVDATTSTPTTTTSFSALGSHDVAVTVTDDHGFTDTATREVTVVDRTPPTVALTAVDANASAATPPAGRTVHTNGTVSFELAAAGTPGDAATAAVVLEATFANFDHRVEATHQGGDTWTATADLSALPDDGTYDVSVVATDAAGNRNETAAAATVRLDREPPALAATVSQFDASTGRVNVTTPGTLDGAPTIEVEKPDGTTETATVEDAGDGYWNASFGLTGDGGQYNVTVTGTDLAGNRGTGTASTYVDTVETENNSATVVLQPSGLFVNFTTDQAVTDTVVMTESNTPLAPLATGDAGVNFLNAQLGDHISGNLSHAVIGIPVDMDAVPGNVGKDDVQIRYYNETTDAWEHEETTVEQRTVLGETREYWVANVTHFSTYGAVTTDDAPPTLDAASPSGDLAAGETNATVRFEYGDAVSGVNASAVSLSFDGTTVTDDAGADVTSAYATYDATGLAAGTYTASVTVVDAAGNTETYDTTFAVQATDDSDDGGDDSDDGTPSGGGDGQGDAGDGAGTGDGGAPERGQTETVSRLEGGGVAVDIRNAGPNATASVRFDAVETGGVALDGLDVAFDAERDATRVEVRPSGAAPGSVPALDAGDPLGYLDVTHDAPADAVDAVTFRFDLPRSALPEGASLDDVTLYRYHDGEWNALETTRNGTAFAATAPGLSVFAVGVDRDPALAVTDAALSADRVEPGDAVTVTATVTNDGGAAGETELALRVDGETVATKSVRVDAGESATVTLTHAFADPGSYEVAVGGEAAGTVVVERATTTSTTTATPTSETTTTSSTGSGGFIPGFGAGVTVLAVLLAALVAARRRRA